MLKVLRRFSLPILLAAQPALAVEHFGPIDPIMLDQTPDQVELPLATTILRSNRIKLRFGAQFTEGGEFGDFGQQINADTGWSGGVELAIPWNVSGQPDAWTFGSTIGLSFAEYQAPSHTNLGSGIVTASQTTVQQTFLDFGITADRIMWNGILSFYGGLGIGFVNADGTFFADGTVPNAFVGASYSIPIRENVSIGVDAKYRRYFGSVDGGAGVATSSYALIDDYWFSLMLVIALTASSNR